MILSLLPMMCKCRKKKMSTGGEKGSATTKTPADFLKSIRGRPVVVKLNSGVDYRGHFLFLCSIF